MYKLDILKHDLRCLSISSKFSMLNEIGTSQQKMLEHWLCHSHCHTFLPLYPEVCLFQERFQYATQTKQKQYQKIS